MILRLGYVAMTLNLEDCTPSGTVTYTLYKKLESEEAKKMRLTRVAKSNLNNTFRILKYNKALNIDVYRLTSKLIPLATHEELSNWDYQQDFRQQFLEIGEFIKKYDFRVSAHPDHFTLLNPKDERVLEDSIKDLDYHIKLFEAMGLYDSKYKLVIHVGGVYANKTKSIDRFKYNFTKLPDRIKSRIMLENDDKSYSAMDVLEICEELKIPMVLDVHHHNCINNGEKLEDLLSRIYDTWKDEKYPPKIHFSSPKSDKDFRSHADYINIEDFVAFIEVARQQNRDIDVMLEAKMKDNALIELSNELSKKGFKRINNGTFSL